MLLYLTYNDQPSGVYWSQVTDVVEHLNTLGGPAIHHGRSVTRGIIFASS